MAAEGKAVVFLFCQHRWKTSHRISTRLGQWVESGVDLLMPSKIMGGPSPKFGAQKRQIFGHFFATSAPDTAYLRNETSHRQTKMLLSIYMYNVSSKSWTTFRDIWPRNGWDPFAHCDPPVGGHYVATIIVATCLDVVDLLLLLMPLLLLELELLLRRQ